MEIRVGVIQSPRELELDLGDEVDHKDILERVERALSGKDEVLWLEDRKGRRVGVASSRLAYVELGSTTAGRKVGFASA